YDSFPIPTANTYPEGIVAGTDGNVWFAENSGQKIGRVTPAGVVTEFPLPEASRVFRIAAGSDGNLWFTVFDGNKIGRVTPAGVIALFLIPTTDVGAYGIAPGPNGHLWFTEFKGNALGRFVIGGTPPPQIDFELPIAGTSLPEDVAWGSDGNV